MKKEEIIKKIIEIRKAKSMSQQDLADAIGRNLDYIEAFEKGERNFGVLNVIRLCNGLGISPIDFYCK